LWRAVAEGGMRLLTTSFKHPELAKWAAENPVVLENFTRQDFVGLPGYSDLDYDDVKVEADTLANRHGILCFQFEAYIITEYLIDGDSIFQYLANRKIRNEYHYAGRYMLLKISYANRGSYRPVSQIIVEPSIAERTAGEEIRIANEYVNIAYDDWKETTTNVMLHLKLAINVLNSFLSSAVNEGKIQFEGSFIKKSEGVFDCDIIAKVNYKVVNCTKDNDSYIQGLFTSHKSDIERNFNDKFKYSYLLKESYYNRFWDGSNKAIQKQDADVNVLFKTNYTFTWASSWEQINSKDHVLVIVDDIGSIYHTELQKTVSPFGFDGEGLRFMTIEKSIFTGNPSDMHHTLLHEEGHHLGLPHWKGTRCNDNLMCYCNSRALFQSQYKDIIIPFMAVLRARLVSNKIKNGKYISPFPSFSSDAKTDVSGYLSDKQSSEYKGLIYKIK
jgi:hypothetical protein